MNLKKQNLQKYLIYTPSYNPQSGGIIVLHKLCHMLNNLGAHAFLFHDKIDNVNYFNTNPEYLTPIADLSILNQDPIVIYPEIVIGNPLNAKHVVRWLLNRPGVIGEMVFLKQVILYIILVPYILIKIHLLTL